MQVTWIQHTRFRLLSSWIGSLLRKKRFPGRLVIAYVLIFNVILSPLAAQQPYWQQTVNYAISVKLVDSSKSLDGNIRINYINRSPDTLQFIWFHLWPNAYKNDRTAFSEQLLAHGKTDFYFSDAKDRGY